MYITKNNQKGFVAFTIVLLSLAIISGIAFSISSLIFGRQKILANIVKSTQSYYIAESGAEDAFLRLSRDETMIATSYSFITDEGSVDVSISDNIGGARTITSEGNQIDRIRKIQVIYQTSSDDVSFFYGAQVGDGGMEMGNNARIKGNVFSNGDVIGTNNKGYIDNSIIVANNGNKIDGLIVGGDAYAYSCESSTIGGDLTTVTGGAVSGCNVSGSSSVQAEEISPEALPISSAKIDEWKAEAVVGGIITDDVTYDGVIDSLGPVQIGTPASPEDLIVTNNSQITITGTVYVTGDIFLSNNALIELDSGYGSMSGVIIADGKIISGNNVILDGSGQAGSYILILSTNSSLDPNFPAILVSNNSTGAIFYTSNGLLLLGNNMGAREITGYKIKINNNAEITYDSGLQSAIFTSGPGASWSITDWREIP